MRRTRVLDRFGWTFVLCVLILLCMGLVATGTGMALGEPHPEARDRADPSDVGGADLDTTLFGQVQPSNNTTVRHADPNEISQSGDTAAVQRHLLADLTRRLNQSSVQLSQGEYQQARSVLGDDYNESLEKYVDVAGETDQPQTAEQLATAQRDQRQYASSVEEYRDTYDRYRAAKQAGNETAARQLARKLASQEQRVNRSGANLSQSFESLQTTSGINTTDQQQTITNTTRNITTQQADVVEAEFQPTTLRVRTTTTNGSFTDPFRISGRLTTNGTPVDNATIVIGHRQTQRTQTNASGRFQTRYRPTTVSAATERLQVRHVPRDTSVYLGSTRSVNVTISPVRGTLRLTTVPNRAAYGDQLGINGTIVVGSQPVSNYSVVAQVGGRQLGNNSSTQSGNVSIDTRLPATIPAGDRSMTVAPRREGLAVQIDTINRSLSIETTPTNVTVTAREAANGTLLVTGRLLTADGQPIANQSVFVSTAGGAAQTVRTGADGRYSLTRSPPEDTDAATVTVTYEGSGTNLAPADAQTRLQLVSASPSTPLEWLMSPLTAVVAALVAGGGYVAWRRLSTPSASSTVNSGSAGASSQSTTQTETDFLEMAREQATAGNPEVAIRFAFRAVRDHCLSEASGEALTHWEVFNRSVDRLESFSRDQLRTLIEQYELATYGPDEVSEEDATRILDLSTEIISSTDRSSD